MVSLSAHNSFYKGGNFPNHSETIICMAVITSTESPSRIRFFKKFKSHLADLLHGITNSLKMYWVHLLSTPASAQKC